MKLTSIAITITVVLASFSWSSESLANCPHVVFESATGELYIPLVEVPDIFGGKTVYEAYLQLLTESSPGGSSLFALKSATPATVPVDTCESLIYTRVTANDIGQILSELSIEYEFTKDSVGEPMAIFSLGGYKTVMFFYGCSEGSCYSLELWSGFNMSSNPLSLTQINDLNRNHRYAKAILDEEDNLIILYDFDLAGGVTANAIKEFIRDFGNLIQIFITETNTSE
jgi:Putative bacterial sensory transduction regulator